MRNLVCFVLALIGLAASAYAQCPGNAPPPPPPPPPPPKDPPKAKAPDSTAVPPGMLPTGLRDPFDPEPESDDPEPPATPGPETPGDGPAPAPIPVPPDPGVPTPPTGGVPAAPTPDAAPGTPGAGPTSRRPRRTSNVSRNGWRFWWEFNRDSLVGTRRLIPGRALTGVTTGVFDPLGERRGPVLDELRAIARNEGLTNALRGAALVALGRAGGDADATFLLGVATNQKMPTSLREQAVLALGLLPEIKDPAVRAQVRRSFLDLTGAKNLSLSKRGDRHVQDIAVLAAGMRGRSDRDIRSDLIGLTLKQRNAHMSALYALAGAMAGDRLLSPERMRGAARGRVGSHQLNDVERSHVVLALARSGEHGAVTTLLKLSRARSVGVHTKRSVALALGELLRSAGEQHAWSDRVRNALVRTLKKGSDPVLRGYAALGLARNARSSDLSVLSALTNDPNADVRPYGALALGVACGAQRETNAVRAAKGVDDLVRALVRSKDPEFRSAACIGVGLAGSTKHLGLLLDVVSTTREPAVVRGAAANGAGLLGRDSMRASQVLLDAVMTGSPHLAGEASLGLGFMSARNSVSVLLLTMQRTKSGLTRARIIRALGHIGHRRAVKPLFEILTSKRWSPRMREQAATALGMIGNLRDTDPLMEFGFDFNHYGTLPVTYDILNQL